MLIPVYDVKEGMILEQDVHSKLGGTVFKKGTILTNEDKEILFAFGVHSVSIEGNEDRMKQEAKQVEKKVPVLNDEANEFHLLFHTTLKKVDQILKLAQGNAQIPIIDLRKSIHALFDKEFSLYKHLNTINYSLNDFTKYDSYHALSVGFIAYKIASWMGMDKGELMQVALAGVLHDIGMNRINEKIIHKKGALSRTEYLEIKKHTLYGYQLLKNAPGLTEGVLLAVLQHHERIDGSGYPLKLKKEKIHQYAKIIAVADIFHAMLSKRNYRDELSLLQTIEQINSDGFGKLDPVIVKTLVNKMINYINGASVLLNNGRKGTIVFIDQQNLTRPWVKVGKEVFNLSNHKEIYIKSIL